MDPAVYTLYLKCEICPIVCLLLTSPYCRQLVLHSPTFVWIGISTKNCCRQVLKLSLTSLMSVINESFECH
jgi:hypothetical protein